MSEKFEPGEFCGLEEYGTSSSRIGGKLKEKVEDFVVEEVPVNMEDGEKFLLCKLEKRNLTTFQAIERVSSKLNISGKRIGYAGLKDKKAVVTQYVTLKGVDRERGRLEEENIKLDPLKKISSPLRKGDLKENKFEITVRDIDLGVEECEKRMEKLSGEIKNGVPNYYGMQRFGGERPVTHLVGRKMLERKFEEAVKTYLYKTFETEQQKFRKARKRLQEKGDFKKASDYFPDSLGYEKQLLKKIVTTDPSSPDGWKRVFKIFPKGLQRLFVHAYQSYIFNVSISEVLRRENSPDNFPAKVPGYETHLTSSTFDKKIREVLERDDLELQDFRFKDFGEVSSEGTIRAALITPDVEIESIGRDEENSGSLKAEVSFSLKPGRYATVVMREIMGNLS